MVTGAAALLKAKYPTRTVREIKSLLMNTAETTIYNNAANTPGYLAPITRIGGGEVRVNRAIKSPAAAWADGTWTGALSFGFVDAWRASTAISRVVTVRNYSAAAITYAIKPTFRYSDDRLLGAIKFTAPSTITIPARSARSFTVKMTINGAKLREWTLDSGANALAARLLDTLEFDGYLNLDNTKTSSDNADPLHLAWHVLPRLSGNVSAPASADVDTTIPDGALDGPAGRRRHADERGRRARAPWTPTPGSGRAPSSRRRDAGPTRRSSTCAPSACRPSRSRPTSARTRARSRSCTSSRSTPGRATARSGRSRASSTSSSTPIRTARPTTSCSTRALNGVADARELVWSLDLNDEDAEPRGVLLRRQRHQRQQQDHGHLRRADRHGRQRLLRSDGHGHRRVRQLLHAAT